MQRVEGGSLTAGALRDLAAAGPAHLMDCDLQEVDVSRLDLSGWQFDRCNLRHLRAVQTIAEGAVFTGCRAGFARFDAARLMEAQLRSCDFNNAGFAGAVLAGAGFTGCKLTGADLTGISGAVTFEDTLLCDAKLRGVSFRKAHLVGVDMSLADLGACDFRDARFEGCSLREAHLAGARFEGADLRGADLGGLRLVDAGRFRGAVVSRGQAADLLAQLGLQVL